MILKSWKSFRTMQRYCMIASFFSVQSLHDWQEIELIHSKLSSISNLGLPRFKQLKKLCLRQNYIAQLDPEALGPLSELEELDLYDNRIKHVGNSLDTLSNLQYVVLVPVLNMFNKSLYRVLDLSFNNLKHVPPTLDRLTSLRIIYFVQNRISHIENLSGVGRTLRSLELGGNKIRVSYMLSPRLSR